jgi:hypothetical protein
VQGRKIIVAAISDPMNPPVQLALRRLQRAQDGAAASRRTDGRREASRSVRTPARGDPAF